MQGSDATLSKTYPTPRGALAGDRSTGAIADQSVVFAPSDVRYIKLGPNDRWARGCINAGEIRFGYAEIAHDICAAGDWERVEAALRPHRANPSKVTDGVREIRDFYTLGPETLWITFADGQLWWAFAHPGVAWLPNGSEEIGFRSRRLIGDWRNTDLEGEILRADQLSSRLTQVRNYRSTICTVREKDYLLRRIRRQESAALRDARNARDALIAKTGHMIQQLHWEDFEVLVDLLITRNGWQRISELGGDQKDVDLVVMQPATGEIACVQVKSRATQAVLDRCIDGCLSGGIYRRLFLACHSPRGMLQTGRLDVHLWTGPALATMVCNAGLLDWVIERLR